MAHNKGKIMNRTIFKIMLVFSFVLANTAQAMMPASQKNSFIASATNFISKNKFPLLAAAGIAAGYGIYRNWNTFTSYFKKDTITLKSTSIKKMHDGRFIRQNRYLVRVPHNNMTLDIHRIVGPLREELVTAVSRNNIEIIVSKIASDRKFLKAHIEDIDHFIVNNFLKLYIENPDDQNEITFKLQYPQHKINAYNFYQEAHE